MTEEQKFVCDVAVHFFDEYFDHITSGGFSYSTGRIHSIEKNRF